MTQPLSEVLADADAVARRAAGLMPAAGLTSDDGATQYEATLKTFHDVAGADKKDRLREVLADRAAEATDGS